MMCAVHTSQQQLEKRSCRSNGYRLIEVDSSEQGVALQPAAPLLALWFQISQTQQNATSTYFCWGSRHFAGSRELKWLFLRWGFPCMSTWNGYFLVMWHSEFPRRHPRDLLTQLYLPIPCTTAPYMQEHHKNKLSNSCIMDLLPHSQNVQSQKRAHTLSHLVCNWCPLFGTVDFSQTFQHSLVLCVNSWGTTEEAALMGEKAWKVSTWQKRVVDFPIIVLT